MRCRDGNIYEATGLLPLHTDIYDDNDLLYKPEGAKYPIILDRETNSQPCPLCGTVNKKEEHECRHCGLPVVKGSRLPVYLENEE